MDAECLIATNGAGHLEVHPGVSGDYRACPVARGALQVHVSAGAAYSGWMRGGALPTWRPFVACQGRATTQGSAEIGQGRVYHRIEANGRSGTSSRAAVGHLRPLTAEVEPEGVDADLSLSLSTPLSASGQAVPTGGVFWYDPPSNRRPGRRFRR